jgi:hypothetical protein
MAYISTQALSASHLNGIGLVASEWSYTEMVLEQLIWQVAGLDNERGYSITTHLGSETKINMLEALAVNRLPEPNLKTELKSCIDKLRLLRTDRNNIVHSIWLNPKNDPVSGLLLLGKQKGGRRPTPNMVKITAKGKLKITNTPYPSKKIHGTATEISNLSFRMYGLLDQMKESERKRQELALAVLRHQSLAHAPDPKPK